MGAAERLYTTEVLGLAVDLAHWPPLGDPTHRAETRAPTCGSTIALDLELDDEGRIDRLGMRVRACAIGQAAAAIFARSARGRDVADIDRALAGAEAWLAGTAPLPEWPGLDVLAPAHGYPARHGALLLPWKAARAALSTAAGAR